MKQLRYTYGGGLVLALVAGAWAVTTQFAGAQQRQVPRFVVEPGWPKPGPRNWLTDRLVTEEMGATCTDAKANVVSLNRGNMLPIEKSLTLNAAPPIVEYDPSGNRGQGVGRSQRAAGRAARVPLRSREQLLAGRLGRRHRSEVESRRQ